MLGRLPEASDRDFLASIKFFSCDICSKRYTSQLDKDIHVSRAHCTVNETRNNVYDFEESSDGEEEGMNNTRETVETYNWQYFGDTGEDVEREESDDEEDNEEDGSDVSQDPEKRKSKREWIVEETTIARFLHECLQRPVPCCRDRCVTKFSPEIIKVCRHDLWDRRGEVQRGQFILDSLKSADRRGDGQATISHFNCQGYRVCPTAWYLLYGISRSSYYMYVDKFKSGQVTAHHNSIGMLRRSAAYWLAHAWLRQFGEGFGDKMPDNIAIHLPSSMTKDGVFEKYIEKMAETKQKTVAKSTFLTMWREEMPGLKIPKTSRFNKCDVCHDLRKAVREATTADLRASIKADLDLHWEQQKQERQVYWGKVASSLSEPMSKLSIIIDGMDQTKTSLPHFMQTTKESEKWKMKMHVTGVLVHTIGVGYAFIDNLRWPHDSNLTCTVLLATLRKVATKYNNRLPDTLFLQMDNCWRECKNRFVFAFLGYLVLRNVFREVQVGYLLVGHTHEDVDQFFSQVAYRLGKEDATTVEELAKTIEACFPNVQAEELDAIFDVKEYLGDVSNNLEQHSCPHAFRFRKGPNNELVFEYKDYGIDDVWKLPHQDEVRLVESLPPAGSRPSLVKPRIERLELDQFETGVSALFRTGKLTCMQKGSLDSYIAKQAMSLEVQDRRERHILNALWPEMDMQAWAAERPMPAPVFTQEERKRIANLYTSFNKHKKTSEPKLKKKRKIRK
ncbi:Hypp5908 [Branchiostoma lanceolatum]|uniref:Hypp5908 protein n=1 Tax=Branchiostoma lanceolatum TaxID=7740 RepID=A0A8J9WGZ3_BRALA|nr:Hypp5908 [Branchiostoma lanceolatum]